MKQQSLAPDEADIGHRIRARIVAAALNQQIFSPPGTLCWEVTPHRAAPPETSVVMGSAPNGNSIRDVGCAERVNVPLLWL
jgi:hypothetical protein